MPSNADLCNWMQQLAPLQLGESWDNVGLLLGDEASTVSSVMTCLTMTPETVEEAVSQSADLVIVHHPLPFKPLGQITSASYYGRLVWKLASAGVALYSAHTAWDSAASGINAGLASRLGLIDPQPLIRSEKPGLELLGAGRFGSLRSAASLADFAETVGSQIPGCRLRASDSGGTISSVAIACGSGGSFVPAALERGCDLLVTGEATFHDCLEAKASGLSLLMLGHFASERFAMVELAGAISNAFPSVYTWSANSEVDPVRNL